MRTLSLVQLCCLLAAVTSPAAGYGFSPFSDWVYGSIIGRPYHHVTRGDSEVADAFKKFEVVPDVLQHPPKEKLNVEYSTGVSVELGGELTPASIRCQPQVSWTADPRALYTLVMIDPDAPSRSNRTTGEVRHWLVTNIPANQLRRGHVISEYIGSGAPQGTGLHRYVFLLYRQPGRIEADPGLQQTFRQLSGRLRWKVEQFARKHGLGTPVAGNLLQAQYDDYVPVLYAQFVDYP